MSMAASSDTTKPHGFWKGSGKLAKSEIIAGPSLTSVSLLTNGGNAQVADIFQIDGASMLS